MRILNVHIDYVDDNMRLRTCCDGSNSNSYFWPVYRSLKLTCRKYLFIWMIKEHMNVVFYANDPLN